MSKSRICFYLPENLQKDFKEQMIKDGYDLKGKSKWVSEAIERLFSIMSYAELVKINDEMRVFGKVDTVSVDKMLKKQLDNAVVDVRRKYPSIEGVQSRIVRTAIVQRLLRS